MHSEPLYMRIHFSFLLNNGDVERDGVMFLGDFPKFYDGNELGMLLEHSY
ncbi:hypothetical protein Hanom_Chr09g00824371 [Helianthus anomalus]